MIWVNEQLVQFGRPAGGAPAYLPAEQQHAWHRLRMARMLFEGKHREYFLDEGRTQFDYPTMRVGESYRRLYLKMNLCKLVALKTADLLFGSKVKLDAPTPAQTDSLDLLARRSKIHSRFHTAAVQASWAGGAYLTATVHRAEGCLDNVEPDEIYPIGERGPDDQYERYVRFATANIGTERIPVHVLLETSYEPGRIVRRVWQLQGGRKTHELQLASWPFAGPEWVPELRTGIADNVITYIPNECGGRLGLSDFDGLIEFQDTVNAKFAQVARVLAKHADPKLGVPESAADEKGNIRSDHDVFFFRTKEEIPTYITYSAELAAAIQDREAAIDAFCVAAEMSQILLGIKKGATPDAARKLRLEATNSLAKVGRKSINIEPAIARAIEVAQRLDQTTAFRRSYPVDPVGVEMRDGLPIDEVDESTIISNLRAAGVMSLEDAVERRKEDPDAAFTEIERLKAEKATQTPSVLLEPEPAADTLSGNSSNEETLGGQEQSDAVATNDLRATVGGSQAIRELQKMYYAEELPREACIANARIVFGFTDVEAADLFPKTAPNAPGGGVSPKQEAI